MYTHTYIYIYIYFTDALYAYDIVQYRYHNIVIGLHIFGLSVNWYPASDTLHDMLPACNAMLLLDKGTWACV